MQERTVERRLRAAIESAPSGLLMVDPEGRIVLVNREIERLFGYEREELLGRSVDLLVPERFRGTHPDFRAMFIGDPKVRAMGAGRDLYGQRKDGSEVPVEIGLTPVATEEGLFVLSSIVDISARKRAEERFRLAVESSPSGMVMVDGTGTIVMVNREIERMFGYARDTLLGASIDLLVPERFHGTHGTVRGDFMKDPTTRSMGAGRDLHGRRQDGSEVPVEIGLNPIATDEGTFVLASIVDISARRAAEAERETLEAQLRQSQKMEALGTLAGGVAHDFNNILGAIVGYAEFLGHEALSDQGRQDTRDLMAGALRGRQLVERIMAFSRRQEAVLKAIPLGPTIEETGRLLRATLPSTIELTIRCSTNLPQVLADATAIQQIVMNLGTNAAHAIDTGGTIEVEASPDYVTDSRARAMPDLTEGAYVVVSVRDSGRGMPPEVQQRAFEPFYTTKPPGSGSGLGLAMVHGLMRDHRGTVRIESALGVGTIVRCWFPTALDQTEAPALAAITTQRGSGQRILYIDDEPTLARLGARRLAGLGYTVTPFTDSGAALEHFRVNPNAFDAIVTDLTMPKMTGTTLARAAREIRSVPVILLTGYAEDITEAVLQEAGIERLLLKPATIEELATAVFEVLGRTPAPEV
ncbi:MAG: PAS domain S-box protein [Gemmatimonadota bacterium]